MSAVVLMRCPVRQHARLGEPALLLARLSRLERETEEGSVAKAEAKSVHATGAG